MIPVGHQPILWHVMQYYSEYGHTRFHPDPRLQGQHHQGVLPELPAAGLRRLRRVGLRRQRRAAEQARGRLARHADRHRDLAQYRRAAVGGARPREGRGDLPRQLQRRSDRREPGRHGRALQEERQARLLPRRPATADLPPGGHRSGWPGARVPLVRPLGHLDQRRLFPAAPRDLRLHEARARSWCSSRSGG